MSYLTPAEVSYYRDLEYLQTKAERGVFVFELARHDAARLPGARRMVKLTIAKRPISAVKPGAPFLVWSAAQGDSMPVRLQL